MSATGKSSIWTRNFICVLITNCTLSLSHNAVNTLVSTYTAFLGAGPKLMGLLTGLFFGVALAMRPVAGPVTTRMDKRKLMIIVYSLGSLVNLGYALFHTIPVFTVFRLLNGIQYAFVGSLGMTIAADSLPKEKMSSGLGVFGVSGAIATSVAPRISIALWNSGISMGNENFGFTLVFLFASVVLAIGVIPSILMTSSPGINSQPETVGKWYQTIISKPAILPSVVMMLLIVSYSLFNGYMVNYGVEISVTNIGVFFTVLALVMLASRPLCGTLSDKLGLRKVFLPGALIFAASFGIIGGAKTLTPIIIGAVLAGIGYGAASPALQSLVMQTEPKARRPVASNTLFVGSDLGFFFGPIIGGFIRDAATYRTVMLFGIIPAFLASVLFLASWPAASRRMAEVHQIEESES